MNNKKAVSAVVATVLIILITVAAVTIIWTAVIPMVRDSFAGTVCASATTDFEIVTAQGYTCYGKLDAGTINDISLQIKRGTKDYNLTEVKVLVNVDGQTISTNWKSNLSATLPGPNEEKKAVIYNITGNIESVKIAPEIKQGNKNQLCDPSATVILTPCA